MANIFLVSFLIVGNCNYELQENGYTSTVFDFYFSCVFVHHFIIVCCSLIVNTSFGRNTYIRRETSNEKIELPVFLNLNRSRFFNRQFPERKPKIFIFSPLFFFSGPV